MATIDISKLSPEVQAKYTISNNTFTQAVKTAPKDPITVELGDSKQLDFKPQFKLMRCRACGKILTGRNKSYCNLECRAKQPIWNKGKSGYSTLWKGGKHSNRAKEKMRIAKLGIKLSEEHRKKISESLRGRMPKNISMLNNSGSNSHWWRGGVTSENEKQRKSKEFKNWRKSVYERDGYKCQKCGENTKDLRPHHIRNFAEYKGLRFDVNNGITLCYKHHREFHKLYGMSGNNKQQLEEYLCL
jgi:hypothetical protein